MWDFNNVMDSVVSIPGGAIIIVSAVIILPALALLSPFYAISKTIDYLSGGKELEKELEEKKQLDEEEKIEQEITQGCNKKRFYGPYDEYKSNYKTSVIRKEISYIKEKNNYNFLLKIKPKFEAESKMTRNLKVNKFIWGLTMIVNEGGNSMDKTIDPSIKSCIKVDLKLRNIKTLKESGYQHALFIIEGVNNGYFDNNERVREDGYFCYIGELRGLNGGGAQGKLLNPESEIRYVGRTKTFMRSSNDVIKIFDSVELDKKKEIKLNQYGRKSKWNKDGFPNCFNYVEEKFGMVGIKMGSYFFENYFVLPASYTKTPDDNKYSHIIDDFDLKKMKKIDEKNEQARIEYEENDNYNNY